MVFFLIRSCQLPANRKQPFVRNSLLLFPLDLSDELFAAAVDAVLSVEELTTDFSLGSVTHDYH